jgi:hypothetical protein
MKNRFLSYGAGMQTFALLVMAEQGELQIDEVVFADTGAEHPETYDHIRKVAKPICDRIGIPFTTVRMSKTVDDISNLTTEQLEQYKKMLSTTSHIKSRKERVEARSEYYKANGIPRHAVTSLRDEIIARRRVPSINPSSRWCTSDAKIVPIYKGFVRPAQARGEYVKPATAIIGLGYEELTRMYKPHLTEYVVEYPLIERKMKRQDCVNYVHRHGYESPPKSGCYFCPFQGEDQWKQLREKHRDLFEDAMALEESDLNYSSYGLFPRPGWTLRRLDGFFSDSIQLTLTGEDFRDDMQCEQAGYCDV